MFSIYVYCFQTKILYLCKYKNKRQKRLQSLTEIDARNGFILILTNYENTIIQKMNIQNQKISLAKLILETDNPEILESVKNIFVAAQKKDFWATIPYEQRQEIEKGLAEIVSEDTVEYETLMKKHRE